MPIFFQASNALINDFALYTDQDTRYSIMQPQPTFQQPQGTMATHNHLASNNNKFSSSALKQMKL